jgi:hypothetical protein
VEDPTNSLVKSSKKTFALSVADLNGDGSNDVVIANGGDSGYKSGDGEHNQVFFMDPCPNGLALSNVTSDNSCYECPSYTLDADVSHSMKCQVCPGGTIGPAGLRGIRRDQPYLCIPCAVGKHRPANRLIDACVTCPSGRFAAAGASDCSLCPLGFMPNAERAACIDIDECVDHHLNGCDLLRGSQQNVPPCLNKQGWFECAKCPDGYVDGAGNSSRSCVLKTIASASSQTLASTHVIPVANLQLQCDVAALVPGSTAQATLKSALLVDIAVALKKPATDLVIKSLMQHPSSITIADVELVLKGVNAADDFNELNRQLADPSSQLMTGAATGKLVSGQQARYSTSCPPGTEPSADNSECTRCPESSFSSGGVVCIRCGFGQVGNALRDTCHCDDGFFNTSALRPACFLGDAASTMERGSSTVCASCSSMNQCISACQGKRLDIKEGWSTLSRTDGSVSVMKCKGQEACPSSRIVAMSNESTCATGYVAPICGACAVNYVLKSDGTCEPCTGKTSTEAALLLTMLCVFLLLLATQIKKIYSRFTVLQQLYESTQILEIQAISRILVATMQILSNLPLVLNITLPETFAALLHTVVSWFKFDFSILLQFGCLSIGGYVDALVVNLVVVLVITIGMGVLYMYKIKQAEQAEVDPAQQKERLRYVFSKVDKDGNGIDLAEVRELVRKVDAAITSDEVETLFKAADTDQSGEINFDEFYGAATKQNSTRVDSDDGPSMHGPAGPGEEEAESRHSQ